MSDVLAGVTLPQFTGDPDVLMDGAVRAEKAGLDSVWLFDHLWPLSGGKERPIFESWTSLAWLAAATERVHIGTLVTRSSLRHPVLLAKMIATVAQIAPGRLIVAIGSGDDLSRDENEAFDLPYLWGADRVGQLQSAVEVVRRFLHEDPVDLVDDFVSIEDLPASPRGEAPPIWVAGRSDDSLEIAALHADGWNGWGGSHTRFKQDAATVAELAGDRAVELTWGGLVVMGRDDASAKDKLGSRTGKGYIVGGPQTVASELRGFVDAGARHVIATFTDPADPEVYELFGGEVVPALRSTTSL